MAWEPARCPGTGTPGWNSPAPFRWDQDTSPPLSGSGLAGGLQAVSPAWASQHLSLHPPGVGGLLCVGRWLGRVFPVPSQTLKHCVLRPDRRAEKRGAAPRYRKSTLWKVWRLLLSSDQPSPWRLLCKSSHKAKSPVWPPCSPDSLGGQWSCPWRGAPRWARPDSCSLLVTLRPGLASISPSERIGFFGPADV